MKIYLSCLYCRIKSFFSMQFNKILKQVRTVQVKRECKLLRFVHGIPRPRIAGSYTRADVDVMVPRGGGGAGVTGKGGHVTQKSKGETNNGKENSEWRRKSAELYARQMNFGGEKWIKSI